MRFSQTARIKMGGKMVKADCLLLTHTSAMYLTLNKQATYAVMKKGTYLVGTDKQMSIQLKGCKHGTKMLKGLKHFSKDLHTALAGKQTETGMLPVYQTKKMHELMITLLPGTEMVVHIPK